MAVCQNKELLKFRDGERERQKEREREREREREGELSEVSDPLGGVCGVDERSL